MFSCEPFVQLEPVNECRQYLRFLSGIFVDEMEKFFGGSQRFRWIDVLAAKMGIDPFDIREMNCYKESEGTTIPTGYPPEVYCEEDLFKKARPLYEAAKKRVAEKNAASDGKMKYGIGVSLGVYGCGLDGVDTSNAFAELNPDGTVTMYAAWEDHGQGADIGVLVSSHETLRQA